MYKEIVRAQVEQEENSEKLFSSGEKTPSRKLQKMNKNKE